MAILRENYVGDSPFTALAINLATKWAGQSFTTTLGYSITRIDLYLDKGTGDNVGTINISLHTVDGSGHPTGAALATGTLSDGEVPESPAWVTCTLASSYNLAASTKYCIVVHGASLSASNVLYWSFDDDGLGASDFAGGDQEWSTDSGNSWATSSIVDQLFKCWGDNIPANDKVYSKKLVAIGNHELWYQTDSTTMTELADANSDINTVNPLTAFELLQKLFIVNQTQLRVADFANSKISTADVGANPPVRGTLLTGGDSGATMIVDFIDAGANAACLIYGYRTSAATFTDTETVTGTNAVTYPYGGAVPYGTSVSFVLDDNEVAAPHWYDWTPFANDTTNFGTMPSSAYISARYRGRAVLAGHPNYPHQWYMSKVADPFDWVYAETNPLTAVAGNNADAGELGDIIRALIPYGDDFLVFGCANSIHILTGDPAFSGQIDEIDESTGIYSPWSWCKDNKGNLYFWGSSGLYIMSGGRSKPVNLSEGYLPTLIDDWAVDPDVHRVILKYDPLNHGIIITRVTLETGDNLNYFYDLKINGFYPEVYPQECGIYSGTFYDSDTPATKGLILGTYDGYLRVHSYDAKNDDIGGSDEAIDAYLALEILNMNEADDGEGLLNSFTVSIGGGTATKKLTHSVLTVAHAVGDVLTQAVSGATLVVDYVNAAKTLTFGNKVTGTWDTTNVVTGSGSGSSFTPTAQGDATFSDSDGVSYELHVADDAETCLEKIKDGAAPHTSGTLTGPGRFRTRPRVRGKWLGLKFYNASASETFVINTVAGTIKPVGNIKEK